MIDLNKLSAQAIETAFGLVSANVGLGTYYQNISGQNPSHYDPVTDTTLAPIGVVVDVRMLTTSATEEELVGTPVTVNDIKILIPSVDLAGYEPKTQDYIDLRGKRYDVIKNKVLPVDSLRIVYCRAK